jgi:hypothetical protein
MISFNSILSDAGIDASKTRLVRHRHAREYQRAVYYDAIHRDPRFDIYQASQINRRVIDLMCSAEVLAVFVVAPRRETVFVGLWRIKGSRKGYLPDPYRIPPRPPKDGNVIIDLERLSALDEYCGRIVVAWGGGERAWVQYAHRRDKQIIELRRRAEEESFPGFARFGCALHEVDALPATWLEPLRAIRGVYLLIHRPSGTQYVGSATGIDGFLGRWRGYANGHGGNAGMRELAHPAEDYDVRILETVGSNATPEDVYTIESLWKEKLGSRVQGLNRN